MCQLQCIEELGTYSKFDAFLEILKRKLRYTKRIALLLRKILLLKVTSNGEMEYPSELTSNQIKPGDTVKVLSENKIRTISNNNRKYKGCSFIEEMYNSCDREYRVLKKVDHFFDEVSQKLIKGKDLFILEGSVCNGKKRLYVKPCDLNCHFFWNKDFLKKI